MLCEFKTSTEAVNLGIHPDKTEILSNQGKKAKEITVDSNSRSCQKETVRDILGKKNRSNIKKLKK